MFDCEEKNLRRFGRSPLSALCGIFNVDGAPVDEALLLRMRDIVDYRGPDGSGIWIQGNVGLAHRLLVTTQESVGEKQPMTNGNVTIVADCRIDNRDELKERFISHGMRADFNKLSDTAYILRAYELWGEDVGKHLLGDFSFVLWDDKRGELFACRDPFGVKPLVYHWDGSKFIFGSEIKQVFQDATVLRELDLGYLGSSLLYSYPDCRESPFKNVRRLAPGSFLALKKEKWQVKKYFCWDPAGEPLSKASLEENAEMFRRIFWEAVKARLRSPGGFRTGSLLSGGLDSSSIVSVAASPRGRLPVFTLHFPEADPVYHSKSFDSVDEKVYSGAVIEKYDLEAYPVEIAGFSPLEDIDRILWHQESPMVYPNMAYLNRLFKAAHGVGVRSLLHGEGGDELFQVGWFWFSESLKKMDFSGFLRECRARHARSGTPYGSLLKSGSLAVIKKTLGISGAAADLKRTFLPLIDKRFARQINLSERTKSDFSFKENKIQPSQGLVSWLQAGHISLYLESMDKIASASQIELRLPYIDLRLFRFMATIPWNQKIRGGISKFLLRESLKDALPALVNNRIKKTEFSPVFRIGIERYARARMEEAFRDPHPVLRSMIRVEMAKQLHEDYFEHEDKSKYSWEPLFLWYITILDIWLKDISVPS